VQWLKTFSLAYIEKLKKAILSEITYCCI